MSKRNEQRRLALKKLVADFEESIRRDEPLFLGQEEFEDILGFYFEAGDFDQTLLVADVALAQHSYTPEFYRWKALIHKINFQEEEALDTLNRLAVYAPNDEESLMLKLEILIHFNKVEEAQEVLSTLFARIQEDKKLSLLHFFEGLIHLHTEEVASAWSSLIKAIQLDPYQEPAIDEALNAAEFAFYQKELSNVLERILDKDPFNHLAWFYLGLWYEDHGEDFKSLDAFSSARSLFDKDARYELSYADKLFDLERYSTALVVYRSYFSMPNAESNYETFMRMGRSYQMLEDLGRAKAAYFKAVEADPRMFDAYQYLGECFAAEGKWGVAAHNYGRAVEQTGHSADCWLGLALCQSALNETEEADAAFRKAITHQQQYSDAIVAYAIFLVDLGEESKARFLLEDSLSRYEDATLLYGMVAVCYVTKRRVQALELLNDALSNYYDDRELLLNWYPDLLEDDQFRAIYALYENR
ncbi:lipopolysaccharide assembly protein LapB [Lewinella sp. 4G2]|uniref:tetratricopeptide repeat protein n=1 Tax=Lewinella sp. 4G2 TaxID=1803372 RepID=UPI0007B4689F|nr:tetratricopeptide repeat protein [Lewinella sp. 4G2]OAV43048.1 hypothetical protein A3850_000390 [Lewinella sp. 4G2]